MANPATIQHFLADVLADEANRFPGGHEYKAYRIPGLKDYVLRVDAAFTPDMLRNMESTTALTPPKRMAKGAHIGQPLLTIGDRFSIIPFQSGKSLRQCLVEYGHTIGSEHRRSRLRANMQFLQQVLASAEQHGTNPFLPLFEQIYGLARGGYIADLGHPNMFWEEEKSAFNLIDQVQFSFNKKTTLPLSIYSEQVDYARSTTLRIDKLLLPETLDTIANDPTERKTFAEAIAKIDRLFNEARVQVTEKALRNKPSSLVFAAVKDVKATSLTLGHGQQDLLKTLNALKAQALRA